MIAGLCYLALAASVGATGASPATPAAGQPVVAAASSAEYRERPEVAAFLDSLANGDGFDRRWLSRVFGQVRRQDRVITLMSRPVLQPPKWHEYAPQFLTEARIESGVEYWRHNQAVLTRAEAQYGVPAEVIVAIIGVETFYGRNVGTHRVIDALSTLAFDYPRRADFFLRELRQFLLLTRELDVSPLVPRGSYAGAMGVPQFMPGSYRAFGVDYEKDGRIDLWRSPADVVGSIAHYLSRHDWVRDGPVLERVDIDSGLRESVDRKLDGGISERRPLSAWRKDGLRIEAPAASGEDPLVALVLLEQPDQPSYWVGFGNFYVITRYNRSRLYASAVWELAQAVRARRVAAPEGELGLRVPVTPGRFGVPPSAPVPAARPAMLAPTAIAPAARGTPAQRPTSGATVKVTPPAGGATPTRAATGRAGAERAAARRAAPKSAAAKQPAAKRAAANRPVGKRAAAKSGAPGAVSTGAPARGSVPTTAVNLPPTPAAAVAGDAPSRSSVR